jgi:transposase
MNDDAQKLQWFADEEDDPLRARRLRAVALVLAGASISAAAREVGMDRTRLGEWCARYRAKGLDGLSDGRDAWRVELSEDQVRQLRQWARERNRRGAWNSSADLAYRLDREFDIWASPVTVQKILREKCGLLWSEGRWHEP